MTFADEYFDGHGGMLTAPLIRFGDEWVEPYRNGPHVVVEHRGRRFQVMSLHGRLVELRLVRPVLNARCVSSLPKELT